MQILKCVFVAALTTGAAFSQDTANFEVGQVRPIAVSDDGTRMFVVNTPDGSLAIYSLATPRSPVLLREVRVGLEPVSVGIRGSDEVWVVDQVSDSISVVSVSGGVVVDTIRTPDEPRDVVFAGQPLRAFVSVATDRQVLVIDPLTRAQVGSVDVFGDDPAALEVSEDGSKVWVAVQRSGNESTIVPERLSPAPPPPTNPALPPAPHSSLIVSSEDPVFGGLTGIDLPDIDVVEIDVASLATREFTGVGTILFGIAQRPGTGEVWVANTEALNTVRFEPNLRGHAVDNRLTRITTRSAIPFVTPIDLNPGINYAVLPNSAARGAALAQPTDLVWNATGSRGFVAAFGSDRIGVIDSNGVVIARIAVGPFAQPRDKRGPRALVLHPNAPLLYASNRLSNSVTVVDTVGLQVIGEFALPFDPTPTSIKEARGFLYDASLSGNGTMSCASCHIDGTTDNLAWDLGDPAGDLFDVVDSRGNTQSLHPMKGPMLTQTLQGLATLAPFHWRGDRPDLQSFNGAFDTLLGGTEIPANDLDDFAAFMESIRYPPNPNRTLADGLSAQAETGRSAFTTFGFNQIGAVCVDCHVLDAGSDRSIRPLNRQTQPMKVAQLRNVYKRTGRRLSARGRTSGFGLIHDGRADDVAALTQAPAFPNLQSRPALRAAIASFVESFDTGTAPAVGHVVSVSAANALDPELDARVTTMVDQATRGACDVVVDGLLDDVARGFWFDAGSGRFVPDVPLVSPRTWPELRALLAPGDVLHLRGVVAGTGQRIGLDRDRDGVVNGLELPVRYGVATPACASFELVANSASELGNDDFALVLTGAAPGTPGGLVLGFGPAAIDLFDLRLLTSLVDAVVLELRADRQGLATSAVPIPNDSGLLGVSLFWQALHAEPCGLLGVGASNGVRAILR